MMFIIIKNLGGRDSPSLLRFLFLFLKRNKLLLLLDIVTTYDHFKGVRKINRFIYNSNNIYNTKHYLINYNDRNFRILKLKYKREKGFEEIRRLGKSSKTETYMEFEKAETERVSLSRSKNKIRELALANNFEYFGTITLNGYFCSRYELDEAQTLLKKQLRNIRRSHSNNFKYLIITEKHLDNAFHFHGLFSGLDLSINEFGYFHSLTLDKLGFNSFSKIKDTTRVANYIIKYISKDCVKNSHNQSYIRSRNLITATKEELNNTDFINNNWKFENDFVCIYDYDLQNLNEFEKDFLFDIIKQ